jgi:hypothetical protein
MSLVIYVAGPIMHKALYLVSAWILMVSYQIFTQSALTTLTTSLKEISPAVAILINSNVNVVVFICSFTWMFVLSLMVSIIMFGKERRLIIQFMVSLVLTLAGSALLGLLHLAGFDLSNPNFVSEPFILIFGNVFFSFFYLALPFIFTLAVDLGLMKIRK